MVKTLFRQTPIPVKVSKFDEPDVSKIYSRPSLRNVLTGEYGYTPMLVSAALEIADRLSLHCGPFAANAAIPRSLSHSQNTTFDEFTKDGITILQHMQTNDVNFEHVRRMAKHIGERVDTACHDGTTTSMLLFVRLISELGGIQTRAQELFGSSSLDLRKIFSTEAASILGQLGDVLKGDVLTAEEIRDYLVRKKVPNVPDLDSLRRAIVYHQASVASKGDKEIAEGVAEVLMSMPVELYGQYVLLHSRLERDERFILETQTYDLELDSNLLITTLRNYKLDQQVLLEDVDLLISAVPFVNESPESHTLLAHIVPGHDMADAVGVLVTEDFPFFKKPTVIIAPEITGEIISAISIHNRIHPEAKIYPFSMQCPDLMRGPYDKVITAMAGVETLRSNNYGSLASSMIHGVKVHHEGIKLKLTGLYQKTDSRYHPYYDDPTIYPRYNQVIAELRTSIEDATIRHSATLADRDLNLMISLYRAATCQKIVDLRICGTTHEMMHNRSVVEDAMGSAISALTDGVVMGGHIRILEWLINEHHSTEKANLGNKDLVVDIKLEVIDAFIRAFWYVIRVIYRLPEGRDEVADMRRFIVYANSVSGDYRFSYLVPLRERVTDIDNRTFFQKFHGVEAPPVRRVVARNILQGDGIEKFISCGAEGSVEVLLQPATGYYEQFKRMLDIIPKVLNTSTLIDTSYSHDRDNGG